MNRSSKSSVLISIHLLTIWFITFSRCSEDKAPYGVVFLPEDDVPQVECPDDKSQIICVGDWSAQCDSGKADTPVNCQKEDGMCVPQLGCRRCIPGQRRCGKSNNVIECEDDGDSFKDMFVCNASDNEYCDVLTGACANLCEKAEEHSSYIGCEYWAVPTINANLVEGLTQLQDPNPFSFAVVIANPQSVIANIAVERAGSIIKKVSIDPGSMETVELEWIPRLFDATFKNSNNESIRGSVRVPNGAYKITSSVPVTAYQFNPLRFSEEVNGQLVYSHTNDASLLLPSHSLSGSYFVMSRPTLFTTQTINGSLDCDSSDQFPCLEENTFSSPGFVAIVGIEDHTTTVEISTKSYIAPDLSGEIPAMKPGDTITLGLEKGEVLQLISDIPKTCSGKSDSDEYSNCAIDMGNEQQSCTSITYTYCHLGPDYDLTGTQINASGKVFVVSGHSCAFVPYNRWACDHLEETMFPAASWGKEIYVALSQPLRNEPNLIRVLSSSDDNDISFTPEVHPNLSLNKGEYLELIADQDFRILGSNSIMVAQFLVGQDYNGYGSAGTRGAGDPGMSLGIPKEQWRSHYNFLAPDTFPDNYVIVISKSNQAIMLDGKLITGFIPIEGTPISTARVRVESGHHVVETTSPFGIIVYGYALYTSYIYPGGLDLLDINLI